MKRSSTRRRRGGFTLMEVLLVLVILVVLGSIAVGVFRSTRQQADKKAAKVQITAFESAIDRYELDVSEFPQELQDLMEEPRHLQQADKWAGPYLQDKELIDPWGSDYEYVSPGENNPDSYDAWSLGPDKADGTDDDIGNW